MHRHTGGKWLNHGTKHHSEIYDHYSITVQLGCKMEVVIYSVRLWNTNFTGKPVALSKSEWVLFYVNNRTQFQTHKYFHTFNFMFIQLYCKIHLQNIYCRTFCIYIYIYIHLYHVWSCPNETISWLICSIRMMKSDRSNRVMWQIKDPCPPSGWDGCLTWENSFLKKCKNGIILLYIWLHF